VGIKVAIEMIVKVLVQVLTGVLTGVPIEMVTRGPAETITKRLMTNNMLATSTQ
jgi:hypothetical protein